MRLLNRLWKKGLAVFRALFGARSSPEQSSRIVLVQRGRSLSRKRKRAFELRAQKQGYPLVQKVGISKGLERASNAYLVLAEVGGPLSSRGKQEPLVAVAIGTVGKRLIKERNVGEISSVKSDEVGEGIEESGSQAVKGKEMFKEIVRENGKGDEESKFDNPKLRKPELKENISKIKGALSEVSEQFISSEELRGTSEADQKASLNEIHCQAAEVADAADAADAAESAERARAFSEAEREADRKAMYETIARINAGQKAIYEEIAEMNRKTRASEAKREADRKAMYEALAEAEVNQKIIDTQIAMLSERLDRLESKKNKDNLDVPISYSHSSLSMKKN